MFLIFIFIFFILSCNEVHLREILKNYRGGNRTEHTCSISHQEKFSCHVRIQFDEKSTFLEKLRLHLPQCIYQFTLRELKTKITYQPNDFRYILRAVQNTRFAISSARKTSASKEDDLRKETVQVQVSVRTIYSTDKKNFFCKLWAKTFAPLTAFNILNSIQSVDDNFCFDHKPLFQFSQLQ